MRSSNEGWAKFYEGWADLMSAVSAVFSGWAAQSYLRSARFWGDEMFSLGEIIQGLGPDLTQFDDHPGFGRPALGFDEKYSGKPWDIHVDDGPVRSSFAVDPAGEGKTVQVFVFGEPALGESLGKDALAFRRGEFEGTEFHPEEEPTDEAPA